MSKFIEFCSALQDKIKDSYEQGVTTEAAERLAGEFLNAQLVVAEELREADLDSRMKKTGVKAIRAIVYMEAATKDTKKPSDVLLEHLINSSELVVLEQKKYDEAEVLRDSLQNYFNIFKEAHIHFRSIAKGSFGG